MHFQAMLEKMDITPCALFHNIYNFVECLIKLVNLVELTVHSVTKHYILGMCEINTL